MSEAQSSFAPVDAVALAGSVNKIALYPGNEPGRKALVRLRGRPLISYVLDALQDARSVGRILVVGAPEVTEYAAQWPNVEGVREGYSLVRNAYRGAIKARTERVLFCNPDQPLLRAEMIDDFVERAMQIDADLVSSWVRHESLGAYEEGEHKFADFGDGRYAHGNLFLVRRNFPNVQEIRRRMDRLYQARKNNILFAWELGPRLFGQFLVSVLCRHLPTLEDTLDIAGKHFGLRLGAVVSPYPEIALDIDEPEDYTAAERHLSLPERAEARSHLA